MEGVATNNKVSLLTTSVGEGSGYASDVGAAFTNSTQAFIADCTPDTQSINVNTLNIEAAHEKDFNGRVRNNAASLIAGIGGARYLVDVHDATVKSSIGSNVQVDAMDVNMSALNDTGSGQLTGTSVNSISAGLAGVGGALFDGEIKHTTSTEIGSGAQINSGIELTGNPTDEGSINLSAINDSFSLALATANASGASSAAEAEAKMDYSTYSATVSVGDNAVIKSTGEISMVTTSDADSRMNAKAVAGALFHDALADATSTITVNNDVEIGAGAVIESEGDIQLIAGQTNVFKSGDGSDDVPEPNILRMRTDAQAYAKVSPAAVSLDAGATSNATNLNQITIDSDASVRTVGNAYLIAETGATLVQASAAGHGDRYQHEGDTSTSADPRAEADFGARRGHYR